MKKERIYSVTMTEEELRLFSEFLAAQEEQKEFGMIQRAGHVAGMKNRMGTASFNAPKMLKKPVMAATSLVKPGLV